VQASSMIYSVNLQLYCVQFTCDS